MRITAPPNAAYHAEATGAVVGPMATFRISSTSSRLSRSHRMISSSDPPYLKVILHRRGDLVAAQEERQVKVRSGELFAFDTSMPYELTALNPCDLIVIGMPRSMTGSSASLISRRTAVPVPTDRGIRSVIATFFSGLADTASSSEDTEIFGPDAARLADAAAGLIVTALTGTATERIEFPTSLADQILAYAQANLHDPALSPDSVARRYGISVRYLHKLMHTRDIQFSAWVRRQRLSRIRQDLLDPRLAGTTAAAIAARWGTCDPGHLSRLLRAEYGRNAAEIRAEGIRLPGPGSGKGD